MTVSTAAEAAPDGVAASSSATTPATTQTTIAVPPVLAAKLAEPGVAESLASLLSHADLVAILVEGLDGMIGRTEVIGDSLLSGIEELKDAAASGQMSPGFDVKALLGAAKQAAVLAPQLIDLLSPVIVDQLTLAVRGVEAGATAYATDPVQVKGIFSLMKLFKDPEITRTASYMATIVKAIGRELDK